MAISLSNTGELDPAGQALQEAGALYRGNASLRATADYEPPVFDGRNDLGLKRRILDVGIADQDLRKTYARAGTR